MIKILYTTYTIFCATLILSNPCAAQVSPPVFSTEGGFFSNSFSLTLSSNHQEDIILYTVDGSDPSPERIGGEVFTFKNQYPFLPGQAFGEMLFDTMFTLVYGGGIEIINRSNEPDKLSQKSSTFEFTPSYFPSSPSFKGTVVRARCWRPSTGLSEIVSQSYFITPEGNSRYGIPVFSIAMDEAHLYGYEEGIANAGITADNFRLQFPNAPLIPNFANNFWRSGRAWEIESAMSFFEPQSSALTLNHNVGIRLHGKSSRRWPRKSFRVNARSEYGQSKLEFPFFSAQDNASFDRVILHNGGGDDPKANMRDAVTQRIFRDMGLLTADAQPAILFINGEYYGLNSIRERIDEKYLERRQNIAESDLEFRKDNDDLNPGADSHFLFVNQIIAGSDLSNEAQFAAFAALVNPESMRDAFITGIYVRNTDWLPNNVLIYRSKVENASNDTRWNFALNDLDQGWAGRDGIDAAPNDFLHTVLFSDSVAYSGDISEWMKAALNNEQFKIDFINRFADLMNTLLLPARCNSIITAYAQEMQPYMPEHIARWGRPANMGNWSQEVLWMTQFSEQRPNFQRQHIVDNFELNGTLNVTLNVSSPDQGHIRINTIDISSATAGVASNPYPWSGTYFKGVPMEFTAVPAPGYKFVAWQGDTDASEAAFNQSFQSNTVSITAIFAPDDDGPPTEQAIHYWHFNAASGVLESIAADTSLTTSALISYPGTGPGFMDDVNDGSTINLQYNEVAGASLRVRNPSNSRALLIQAPTSGYSNIILRYAAKRTTTGAQIQNIAYRTAPGTAFIPFATINPGLDYNLYTFDFSQLDAADNNPHFAIRITFGGKDAGGSTGNNRFDNISISGFEGDVSPLTHFPLADADFSFDTWSSDESPGSYPDFMQFHWSNDPSSASFDILADATAPYDCAYNLSSRPRINGLGEQGFSFISTGNPQFDDCTSGDATPTRYVGSASIALNTMGVSSAQMSWTARLVSEGVRQYAMRLQYRIGSTGGYADIDLPTTFSSLGKLAGSSQNFLINLPTAVLGEAQAQLRFVYYQEAGTSGNRPEIGIDDVLISASPIATPLLTASPSQIEGLYTTAGAGPGASLSYTLTGSNLEPASGSISIFIPQPFQASLGGAFTNVINLPYSGGSFSQSINIRLGAGAVAGSYSGVPALHSGGGAGVLELPLQGEVGFAATLNPGDIAILGFRSVANDGFSMATWVPLPTGTGIIFTDKAWDGQALLSNENAMAWINNTGATIPAGTVIKFGGPELGNGTGSSIGTVLSGDLSGLSQNGDNIFAIQGGIQQPHWVYALSYLSPWLTEGAVSNATSYLPQALNTPLASNVLMELNAQYNGSRNNQGSFNAYKNLVHNTSLWISDNDGNAFGDFNTTSFTLGSTGPCTASGGILSAPANRSFCVGTGSPSAIDVSVSGASGTNQRWGLINQDGDIVASRINNSLFNLDLFPPGNYSIRYMRFENNANIASLSNISDIANLQGCFAVSGNAINLFLRPQPNGGVLTATSPTTVCKGQGALTSIQLSLAGSNAENNLFALVSQSQGNQLVLAHSNPGFNLNPYPAGQYFAISLAYQQGVNLQGVQFASQLQGCFDLSNPIAVSLVNCLAPVLESSPNPTTGMSMVQYSNPQEEYARLEVYDMQGRLVAKLYEGIAEKDVDYTFQLDLGQYSAGVYLLRLTTSSDLMVHKIVRQF